MNATGQYAIESRNLSKRYGRKHAVEDLSFAIEHGQITGFLGPNGSGKTTTLRMLAGLIRPTSGEGRMLGRPVPGPALLETGTMIEEPSFYPYLSGRRNLQHAAMLHGGVPEQRIDEVLAFVHMENAADKKVGAYSQGMRQRLGLARAMLWQPRVLLLDEPTNGLDPVGIAEIREALREVGRQGVTILISSHILAELEKLVERVLVIERGRMLYDGALEGLVSQIQQAEVQFRLRATDMAGLRAELASLGLEPADVNDGSVRVAVSDEASRTLIGDLSRRGVELTDARREQENLEHAYLRLLREDGRPS